MGRGQTLGQVQGTLTSQSAELFETLARRRSFLGDTVRDLSDEQTGQRTTASELCRCLVKHLAFLEQRWISFILYGFSAMASDADVVADWATGLKMLESETLAGLLRSTSRSRAGDRGVRGDLA